MTRGRPALGAHAALRWPLAPLLELARMSPSAFARAYGISGTVIRRAAIEGCNDRHADHWATRVGYHPAQVWGPDWFTAALPADEADVVPGRQPAPTRAGNAPGRSTGHTEPRTRVPERSVVEAVAS